MTNYTKQQQAILDELKASGGVDNIKTLMIGVGGDHFLAEVNGFNYSTLAAEVQGVLKELEEMGVVRVSTFVDYSGHGVESQVFLVDTKELMEYKERIKWEK